MGTFYDREYELSLVELVGADLRLEAKLQIWKNLDVKFKVEKTSDASPNFCEIEIYNLSEKSRSKFTKDQGIIFSAGYKDFKGQIFAGFIDTFSHKKADLDWVTKIKCIDGLKSLRDVHISLSFGKEATEKTVVEAVAKKLKIDIGKIKIKKPLKFNRGFNMSGWVKKSLDDFATATESVWMIRDNKLYFFPRNEILNVDVPLLKPTSGVIGSPEPTEEGVKVKSLLNHEINVSESFKVESRELNGEYIATKVTHEGDTKGSNWYTTVEGIFRA
jgi:hypothetical protein